jgi:hypothetical protein
MISTTKRGHIHPIRINDILSYQRRALLLIESNEREERMRGYALLTTCFHYCSKKIQKHIREKWKQETDFKRIKKNFIEYCKEIFIA